MSDATRRWLGVVGACVAFGLSACAMAGQPMGMPDPAMAGENAEAEARLQVLFQDISTINLLNGLRLTREQTAAVLALAREAEDRRRKGPGAELYRITLAKAVEAYEAFKADANQGEPPGRRLSRNAVYYEHRILALKAQRARRIDQRREEFEGKLHSVLSEGQLQIIESFEPCLVPPRDLKDPVRAGQVADDRGVTMLAHLRKLPGFVWGQRKDQMAEGHLRRAVEGDRIEITNEQARAALKKAFIDVVERARAMSDVEFEMEKSQLAARLSPKQSRQQLFERARVARPKGRPQQVSRAARWLLHPRIIPILEERLKSGQPFQSAPGASQAAGAAS